MGLKIFLLLMFVLTFSCSSEKPKGKTEAEVLFLEAKQLMKEDHYLLATEKLNQLKHQFPYSFYSTPAELMLADILFKQESYVDAAAAYLLFRDFHPKHAEIPYVVFKIAESYFKQLPDTFDRDLSAAYEAIKYYNELLSKYPKSEYTKDAEKNISECHQMIRNKEQYIADFYYKTEVFDAARYRYLDIIKSFKKKDIVDHAIIRTLQASLKLKEYDKCLTYSKKFSGTISKKRADELQDVTKNCQTKLR